MTETSKPDPARDARLLLRASRAGSLATSDKGQPFASLITPATARDGSVLMLLSGLSPHTRHLRAEPRCSVMVMGAATGPNPQTAPRLSLTGAAAPEPAPELKARWVALHPYAAFYADLGDFQLWRFRANAGQYVGGFASAHRLTPQDLFQNQADADELGEAEILERANAAPGLLDRIARAGGAGWRMVACDADGFDIAREDTVLRIAWPGPVARPDDAAELLIRLAGAA